MRVAFRVDASLEIGTGHVMRCLTLADAMRHAGTNCFFLCREKCGNLLKIIHMRGYQVRILDGLTSEQTSCESPEVALSTSYEESAGPEWSIDAQQTQIALGEETVDLLVVDHYSLDARWEVQLRPACHNLMVIDDLANRPHECDILLDQNIGRRGFDYDRLLSRNCKTLIGPNYALLRPRFSELRSSKSRTTIRGKLGTIAHFNGRCGQGQRYLPGSDSAKTILVAC